MIIIVELLHARGIRYVQIQVNISWMFRIFAQKNSLDVALLSEGKFKVLIIKIFVTSFFAHVGANYSIFWCK